MFATDDSDSIVYDQKGIRIKQLQIVMNNFARVYDLARDNGIVSVRFLNTAMGKKNIKRKMVKSCIEGHTYGGVTRVGNELKNKILDKFVSEDMKKPLLAIVITDGRVGSPNHQYSPFFSSNG